MNPPRRGAFLRRGCAPGRAPSVRPVVPRETPERAASMCTHAPTPRARLHTGSARSRPARAPRSPVWWRRPKSVRCVKIDAAAADFRSARLRHSVRLVFKPADTGYWILEYPVSGIRSLKITKKAKIKPDSGYSSIRKVIFPDTRGASIRPGYSSIQYSVSGSLILTFGFSQLVIAFSDKMQWA